VPSENAGKDILQKAGRRGDRCMGRYCARHSLHVRFPRLFHKQLEKAEVVKGDFDGNGRRNKLIEEERFLLKRSVKWY
jgi:hypothetical protein